MEATPTLSEVNRGIVMLKRFGLPTSSEGKLQWYSIQRHLIQAFASNFVVIVWGRT